jgi:hypothetical protein
VALRGLLYGVEDDVVALGPRIGDDSAMESGAMGWRRRLVVERIPFATQSSFLEESQLQCTFKTFFSNINYQFIFS